MTPPLPPRWTDAARPGARVGHEIEAHERIGSTNDRARALLAGGREGVAVVADEQTAGRGRHGRTWLTPLGRGLAVSVGVRPALRAADGWQLALAVGLAARAACDPTGGAVWLKWPNDVVASDGRKLGGILVETTVEGDRIAAAVIGVGINVDWRSDEMPAEIAGTASSLVDALGRRVERVEVLARLLVALEDELAALAAGRAPVARYVDVCSSVGLEVRVEAAGRVLEGRAVGIGNRGELLVETPHGTRAVDAGEVVRTRTVVPA